MKILKIGLVTLGILVLNAPGLLAQRMFNQGVMQYDQMMALMNKPIVLSKGTLAQLQTDSNFVGNFQSMVNEASTLLDGYTIVRRGGYFPENQGIPRDRQLTTAQVAYRIYSLDNRYELVLFRTPRIGTAQYFIRRIEEAPTGAPAPTPTPAQPSVPPSSFPTPTLPPP